MFKKAICILWVSYLAACSVPSEISGQNEIDAGAKKQPNVVFILVDDMGFGDVGYNGSEIATPNLDQMANAGVQLNRNYVYPVCSPTRAALLTGQDPFRHGIDGPMGDHTGLPLDVKIMPEYFKDMGYQTFLIGKWHLGIGNTDYWPGERGFDYHYGHLGGWVDFYTHMYNAGLDWQRNGRSVREEGHATDLLTADAIRKIETRDPSSSMFMYLAYNAPHSPIQHVPEYSGLNEYPEISNRSVYAEMVTHLDAGIGSVISALESQGILDNTIVVFSSDNGGAGSFGADNGELRQGKGSAFEGGIRVPGIVWWPGRIEGGRIMEQPLVVFDWLPTLMDAVGGSIESSIDFDGVSLWDTIASDIEVDRERINIGIANSKSVIDWPWKLVRQVRGELAGDYLFNIVDDPSEQTELSAQYPEKFASLIAALESLPVVESRAVPPSEPRPSSFFRAKDGGWDYDLRVPETRGPWAEELVHSLD